MSGAPSRRGSEASVSAEAYAAMKESENPEIAEAMRLLSKYTDHPLRSATGGSTGSLVSAGAPSSRFQYADEGSSEEESDTDVPDAAGREAQRRAQQHYSELGLLQRELHKAKQQLREQQDELHFARVRVQDRDRRLGESQEESRMLRQQHDQVRRQCDDLRRTCHAQYTQNLEMQYALHRGSSSGDLPLRGLQPRQDQASAGFQHQKDLTLRCMRLKKTLRETRRRMADRLAQQEQQLMWNEDPDNSTVGQLMEMIRQRDEAAKKERERFFGAGPGRSSLVHVHVRHSERSEASWDLPKHKTTLVTTEDKYIDCKIAKSGFRDPLRQVREELYPIARDFKESSDKCVTELWYLYNDKRHSLKPREDFFKKTSGQLTKAKVLLAEMLRRVNTVIKSFLKEEKDIKERWLLANVPTNHAECQADIPGPPDPIIEEQAAEIKMLRERLDKLRQQNTAESSKLSLAKEKAELNLQFLQGKLFALHRELYTNLHLVYKHRYKWIARLPDPLRDLKLKGKQGKLALDLQFNLKLGDILDRDIEYLKVFGQYFTSDETFGVDMSTHAEREAAALQRQPTARDAMSRRRSSLARKEEEQQQQQQQQQQEEGLLTSAAGYAAGQSARQAAAAQPGAPAAAAAPREGSAPAAPAAAAQAPPQQPPSGQLRRRHSTASDTGSGGEGPARDHPQEGLQEGRRTPPREGRRASLVVPPGDPEPRARPDSSHSRPPPSPSPEGSPRAGASAAQPPDRWLQGGGSPTRAQSPGAQSAGNGGGGRRQSVPARSVSAHPPNGALLGQRPGSGRHGERRNTAPPVQANPPQDAGGAESALSRMENWRRKQQQLWEGRRREHALIAKEQIPYVAAREVPGGGTQARILSPPGAVVAEDHKTGVVQQQRASSEELPSTSGAAPPLPPGAKDTVEVFNRIILKRRNLPLRPTREPNLQEGAYGSGYLLEGNRVSVPAPPA